MNNVFDINNLQGEYKTGFVADDGALVTPVCRLSYDHLYQKTVYKGPNTKPGEEGTPYFGATGLFNCQRTNEPGLVDFNSVVWKYLQETAQGYFASVGKKMPFDQEAGFYGFWDGARKEGTDGYGAGVLYLSAKNYSEKIDHIPVVDSQRQHVGPNDIKAGDFVRMRIRAYVSSNYEHKGINLQLKSMQLIMPWDGFSSAKEDTGDEWGQVPIPTQVAMPSPMPGTQPLWGSSNLPQGVAYAPGTSNAVTSASYPKPGQGW